MLSVTEIASDRPRFAFDADVLIYAAAGHPLGRSIRDLFTARDEYGFSGSVLLLPELFIKPTRSDSSERRALQSFVSQIELLPATIPICEASITLGAQYGLPTVDAVHLATAIHSGADIFLTNNRKDFPAAGIEEIDVVFPDELSV